MFVIVSYKENGRKQRIWNIPFDRLNDEVVDQLENELGYDGVVESVKVVDLEEYLGDWDYLDIRI